MGLSRPTKISILLAIDVVFFLVELIVGYAVGSLALVADSFHMLNDVMSLIVALYAIKLTNNKQGSDSRYSYGWHRAEILAALINGVFLLALCFSIFLEALERFFGQPEISNPRLVVVVGSLGLASNLVGLVLFHEHSHSHAHPPSRISSGASSIHSSPISGNTTPTRTKTATTKVVPSPRDHTLSSHCLTPLSSPSSESPLYGHPVATRAALVQTAQEIAYATSPSPPSAFRREHHHRPSIDSVAASSLLAPTSATKGFSSAEMPPPGVREPVGSSEVTPLLAEETDFSRGGSPDTELGKPGSPSLRGHTHAAGSMNMRALILHVIGDALGNVGVIATGLIIWLTTWKYKYFCDPIISLVITVIIFSSALPLVRSASFILLQGVPPTVSLEEVRKSILSINGVLSLHELHVWQLSENKLVASVHVLTSRNHDFMPIAVKIREVLHHLGIHSCTIQPEYHPPNVISSEQSVKITSDTPCLILCPEDEVCNPSEHACCPPPTVDA